MRSPTEQASLHRRDALLLVLALGAGAGFARVVGLSIVAFGLNRFVQHGKHLLWMAPVSAMVLAGLVGAVVWLVGGVVSKLRRPASFVAIVMWPLVTSLGFDISGLHYGSAMVLGLGVAVVTFRLVVRAPDLTLRLGRRLGVIGALAALAGFLALTLGSRWREETRARGLAAPGAGAPNILLVILDTVRSMSLSAYGYDAPTARTLERLAARGVRFQHAYAAAPWTTPSHASIMTGRWPFELGLDWLHGLDDTYPTLAEILTSAGYLTAGFTANVTNTSISSGIPRGFEHYEDYSPSIWNVLRATGIGQRISEKPRVLRAFGLPMYPSRKRSPEVTGELFSWLDRQPARPFFVFLNYFDAHDPYEAPPDVEAQFGVRRGLVRHNLGLLGWVNWDSSQVAEQRRAYEAAIAYQDAQLQLLFDGLHARGKLDNTIVIVTADHGEEFFEHRLMFHGTSLYRASLEVPLIIAGPGVPGGKVVTEPASLRSIARTVLALVPGANRDAVPGMDLLRMVGDTTGTIREPVLSNVDVVPNTPESFPAHHGPLYSVLFNGYRYIVDRRGVEQLFSLDDAAETADLVRSPTHASIVIDLKERLRQALDSRGRESRSSP